METKDGNIDFRKERGWCILGIIICSLFMIGCVIAFILIINTSEEPAFASLLIWPFSHFLKGLIDCIFAIQRYNELIKKENIPTFAKIDFTTRIKNMEEN